MLLNRGLEGTRTPAQMVEAQVHDDPVQPRGQAGATIKPTQISIHLYKGLLRHVARILRIPGHPISQIVHLPLAPPDQFIERRPIALQESIDQFEIRLAQGLCLSPRAILRPTGPARQRCFCRARRLNLSIRAAVPLERLMTRPYFFRRWCLVRFSSFLCLCLLIFCRRFLTTLPTHIPPFCPYACSVNPLSEVAEAVFVSR